MPNQKVVTAQTPVEVIFTKGSLAPFAQRLTIRISGKAIEDNKKPLVMRGRRCGYAYVAWRFC
jgi:hypothetical protein